MNGLILAGRVIVALGAVFGALWWLARRAGAKGVTPDPGTRLVVLARTTLSRTAGLALVEVAGTRLLVGISEHQVNLLQTLPAPDPASAPAGSDTASTPDAPTAQTPAAGDFADQLDAQLHDGDLQAAADARPASHAGARSPLSGSLLSADTWRDTYAALRRSR